MAQPVWNTPAGSIGTFPSLIEMTFQLSASAVLPAVSVTYAIISGSMPNGISMTEDGSIYGTPSLESIDNLTYTFVVRVTDNYANIRDRTFSMSVSGSAVPQFTTIAGSILNTPDSTWIELPIEYTNPISSNPILIRVIQGELPPGLEINSLGLIRGYAQPPFIDINLATVTTTASATTASNNAVTCLSTTGFRVGRPVLFTGTSFGGLTENETYYVQSIIDENKFTISNTVSGPPVILFDAVGSMAVNLPTISIGQPTIKTYSFTLKIESPLGGDLRSYYIAVVNQNTPIIQGGPGNPPNTRIPAVYNTRPQTYDITQEQQDYGYYVLPPLSEGYTYAPTELAYIGQLDSDNYFSFRILGHDFDNNPLEYIFADLPVGLTGDSGTGWITGTPVISPDNISEYTFSVAARKASNPSISTPYFRFSFRLSNDVIGRVTWITPNDLGEIFNGTVSVKSVVASCDIPLSYRILSGSLPPNLTLLSNGEITGVIAYQPTSTFLNPNISTTFTFTIQAYSPEFSIVNASRTFTLSVLQEYNQPTDTLYIKCTPSLIDRSLITSLLTDDTLIPDSYLYRPNDPYFGKASDVVYVHAYGIYASNFDEYVEAVTKNHYWRNITLGELSTAVAKNEQGEIIYEVVYSNVIDNLINPKGQSVSEEIYWPRFIDLNQGPWYTSVTNIYTSYETYQGVPTFYTSLTPGYARILYPNSLPNMRNRVGHVLGQEYDFRLLPLWMTSQQENGSTLGFTPSWVICYTKPGFSNTVKTNIQTNWTNELGNINKLNQINFQIDRFSVDKSITYNYDKNVSPPAWTGLPSASPVPDPLDSKDFYVLFPRKTILPDETQY